MNRIEDVYTKLTITQFNLTATQNTMSTKLDDLLQKMPPLETSQHSSTTSITNLHSIIPSSNPHHMKLEVPRFDGLDPLEWIFKITQFFKYHLTLDQDRLTISSFYMDGPTLAWFQWLTHNGQLASWPGFLQALETRFASS